MNLADFDSGLLHANAINIYVIIMRTPSLLNFLVLLPCKPEDDNSPIHVLWYWRKTPHDCWTYTWYFLTLHPHLASFPGPAQLSSLAVRKSGRGPGIIHHVSDIEGREKVERT